MAVRAIRFQDEQEHGEAAPTPRAAARPTSVAAVLALQCSAGNRAVAAALGARRFAPQPVSEGEEAQAAPLDGDEPFNFYEEAQSRTRRVLARNGPDGGRPDAGTPDAGTSGGRDGGTTAPPAPTVTPVVTPQDNFTGRSTTDCGVGEVVDLSFTSAPAGTAASMGGLTWSVDSGPGTVVSATQGTGTLTCGDTAGAVALSLKVVSGARAGTSVAMRSVNVVAPNDALMVRKPGTGLNHTTGKSDVGFKGEVFLRPKTVSFKWVNWREGTVASVATGSMAHWNGKTHAVGGTMPVDGGNSATGSKVFTIDTVYSGQLNPPFAIGDYKWDIPWEYQVAPHAWKGFTKALHHAECDAAGVMQISKKGAGPFSKAPADATSTY